MLAKFSGLNPKGPYLSLEKEKENFCVVITYSIKWASEIVPKSVMHVQRFSFANLNLFLSCCCKNSLLL